MPLRDATTPASSLFPDVPREWSFVHENGKRTPCDSEGEARRLSEIAKGKVEWRTAWRGLGEERLVTPAQYCQALFEDWPRAIRELLNDPGCRDYDRQQWEPVLAGFAAIYPLPIMKSNYLARRIYGAELHRTEKCPIHKGRWSGCYLEPCDEGCASGYNHTGWLPARHEFDAITQFPKPDERWAWGFEHPERHCKHCGGLAGALVHEVVSD